MSEFNVTVNQFEDEVVVVIESLPSTTLILTEKAAGDQLFFLSQHLTEELLNHHPYTFNGLDGQQTILDYTTASNMYFALMEWSERFHDEIAAMIMNELNNVKLN